MSGGPAGKDAEAAAVAGGDARVLVTDSGAMLSGHFLLSSGLHSDTYVQKARVLEDPRTTMALAGQIASWYEDVSIVVAPAVGAISLGFAVALAAGSRSVFAEREGGRMTLRRGFRLEPGERTLIVEDVVTTGASAAELWDLAADAGAERLGVASIIDRSTAPLPFPLRAVVRVDATAWPAETCPLCAGGQPFDAPGSRHMQASR
jgi:orotate phosphoribosyltransferase